MARRTRRKTRRRTSRRRNVARRPRRATTRRANPRRRRRRRRARRRNTARPLTSKAMYTNPRRRRRKSRRRSPARRRSYRRNPRRKFKLLPSMAQIKMSLWGGAGFLTNKIVANAALYGMARWIPGFNSLPGMAKAVATPIVGTALSTVLVRFAPSKGRAYMQAGVNIALGYGLLQALLVSTGIAAKVHPILHQALAGDDFISSGSLAGMGDYVMAPQLGGVGDYLTAGLGETALPGHYAAEGIEPYASSGSLMAGGMGDFYYGV